MAKDGPKQKSNAWIAVLALIFAPFIFGAMTGDDESEPETDAAGCLEPYDAFLASRHFVRESMKSPGTAEVSNSSDSASKYIKTDDCRYRTSGYVDAQNSFGATLRTKWWAEIEYDRTAGEWILRDLTTDE